MSVCFWMCKRLQRIKLLIGIRKNLSLPLRTHMLQEENGLPQAAFWPPHTWHGMDIRTHTNTCKAFLNVLFHPKLLHKSYDLENKINPEDMTEEWCKHFRKLLGRIHLGNSRLTSPGECEQMLVQTDQSKGSFHLHLGDLIHLWGLLTGTCVKNCWWNLGNPQNSCITTKSHPTTHSDLMDAAL